MKIRQFLLRFSSSSACFPEKEFDMREFKIMLLPKVQQPSKKGENEKIY